MGQRNRSGRLPTVVTRLYERSIRSLEESCSQPPPQTAGYIFILAAGTGISVTGGLLPAHLSWWWLDTVGHIAGGWTLTLGLLILLSRTTTTVSVILLSVLWEVFEWTIGYPFIVSLPDTKLDLLAGWFGMVLALSVTWKR